MKTPGPNGNEHLSNPLASSLRRPPPSAPSRKATGVQRVRNDLPASRCGRGRCVSARRVWVPRRGTRFASRTDLSRRAGELDYLCALCVSAVILAFFLISLTVPEISECPAAHPVAGRSTAGWSSTRHPTPRVSAINFCLRRNDGVPRPAAWSPLFTAEAQTAQREATKRQAVRGFS